MSTPKLVFALALATVALVGGVFVASDVRAGALDGDLPDVSGAVQALDAAALEKARAFDGEWAFVGGQKERDGIDQAIAASMDAVNPLVRKLGTKRLAESNPVPKQLSIAIEGSDATIEFDGSGHKANLDGTPVKAVSPHGGEKIKVSHSMRGSKLIEFIDGGGGDRHNHLRLNGDGTRLTMDVKITSGHLPVPCQYRLTFKRK